MSDTPPDPPTDRDRLFVTLAVQTALLDAERAEEAQRASLAEGVPLPELVVRRGWLDEGARDALENLLLCKLGQHKGDLGACLASLAGGTPDFPTLAGQPDPPTLDAATVARGGPASTAAPPPSQRYRRLSLHARGGIGQVWVARDDSLGRDVALKELRPERAGDGSLAARFLTEARVTGQLEHPGVVPVYELASRPDDREPFYTMRFVKGRTLTQAVADYHRRRREGTAGPLDLQTLLTAFVSVCNTLAYAHSRGVIHRDLKPDNVVLGDYGEVMVLDWGLAKVLGNREQGTGNSTTEDGSLPGSRFPVSGSLPDETQAGHVLGTPAYMAPEQAQGRPELVGPHTDVYGLGALLYDMLTGRPPHTGSDPYAILEAILRAPTPRARAAEPSAPRALDAVCAKAMAADPAARYPGAGELAKDVQCYLAGEPVSAWREPFLLRARRWLGRHRTLVSVALAMILVGTAALAVATVLLTDANDREQTARRAAEDNEQAAQLARTQAETNEKAARRRFQLAIKAVESVVVRTSDDEKRLKFEPRMERLRLKILDDALGFFETLLKEAPADPSVRWHTAWTHLKASDICQKLAERRRAVEHVGKSITGLRSLVADYPDDIRYRWALTLAIGYRGDWARDAGRYADAAQDYREAAALLGPLLKREPDSRNYLITLATYNSQLARSLTELGRLEEAVKEYEAALALRRRLAAAKDDQYGDYGLADVLHGYGYCLKKLDRPKEAEECYREALGLFRKLHEKLPADLAYRNELAGCLNSLGLLLAAAGRRSEARAAYEEALPLKERLAADFPAVISYRTSLGHLLHNLGNVERESDKAEEAERWYRRAIAIRAVLASERPEEAWHRQQLGQSWHNLGLALHRDAEKSVAAYREALTPREALVKEYPDHSGYRTDLAWTYYNLGLRLSDLKRHKEALAAHARAAELRQRLAEVAPKERAALEYLAWGQMKAASAALRLNDLGEARSWLDRAAATLERLRREHPDSREINALTSHLATERAAAEKPRKRGKR